MMLKLGIIGIGKMGRYHLNISDELQTVEIMGICDANEDTRKELSEKFKYDIYSDYKELLPKVEAVILAVPTKYHYEIAKECLLAGVHVLVEKPITTDLKEAEELFKIAAEKNLVLHIGHVERFNGAVQELGKIVKEPHLIESRRVGPYNPAFKNDSIVLDLMIHDIDIIINVLNKDVKHIQAAGSNIYSNKPDFASVQLVFENDIVANILVSRVTQKKDRTMTISQEDAFINLDYTNQDINIYRKGQSEHIFGNKELKYKNEYIVERLFVYKDNPLKQEIKHFIDCITGDVKRVVTVEHELRSLKVALRIDEMLMNQVNG